MTTHVEALHVSRILRQEYAHHFISAFVLFSLFYFSYIYFYDFDEGVSAAPVFVKAVKDFIYFFFAIAMTVIVLRLQCLPSPMAASVVFLPFALALLTTSLIHAHHTSLAEQLWENIKNVFIYIPLFTLPFYFSSERRNAIENGLLRVVAVSAFIQCVFAGLYHGLGGRLWLDGIYAGLIGNPNSFALLLNLTASIIFAYLERLKGYMLFAAFSGLALLTYIMLQTGSGSQGAIFVALFFFALVFRPYAWFKITAAAALCGMVTIINSEAFHGALFTMQGAVPALLDIMDPASTPSPNVSTSVSVRIRDITDVIYVLSGDALTLIFGNFENTSFRPMDGQFWVFIYNGGLLTFLTFSFGAGYVYFRSFIHTWLSGDDRALVFHLMIVVFGITFLASRILMYFPFNFLFFLISGLAVARAEAWYKSEPLSK